MKRLTTSAKLPVRGSQKASGYDLYADGDWTIKTGEIVGVSTGVSLTVPDGCVGIICDRSGMASKGLTNHVVRLDPQQYQGWLDELCDETLGSSPHPLGRVIDPDYTGEIRVLLINGGTADYAIKKGDRIAQIVLFKTLTPEVLDTTDLPVQEVQELGATERGAGGFGSTG